MILTSGTEQYLITWKNKKYIFLLTTTLTISDSEEYVERCMEEMESRAQYYDEHPELIDAYEEDEEEDQLYKKINTAIWSCDVETIKKCFPEIDKNNKGIQSMLTWKLAKDVMKDKQLRRMYYEKYGEKYKVKKEKRWWERG